MEPVTALILGLAGLVVLLLLYALHLRRTVELRARRRLAEMEGEMGERIERERREAVESSRAVLKGKVGEHFAPLMEFPFEPSDARFVGSPVDYVVFDGYTSLKDGDGEGLRIVLVDVKTGGSSLTKEQRAIRDAAEAGRVGWRTVRL